MDSYSGGTPAANNSSYYGGEIPFIRSAEIDDDSTALFLTQSGLSASSAKWVKKGDVLYALYGANSGNASFAKLDGVINQAVLAIKPKEGFYNAFLMYWLQKNKRVITATFLQGGQGNLSGSIVKKLSIHTPRIEEQERIGILLIKIDDLIAAEKRKLRLLKLKQQSLLQQVLRQKLRFKEFTDTWRIYKLGDLYEVNHERNDLGLPASKTLSVSTMSFNSRGNGAEESSILNYKILRIGDIAFEGHQTKMHPYGRFVLNDVGVGIMSPRFTSLRPKKEQIISFWKFYINNEIIMNKILVFSTKAGTMMNELVVDDFGQQLVCVPSKEEQRVIGNLFIELDSLVAAETRKVDLLELKKKALLQQMFV